MKKFFLIGCAIFTLMLSGCFSKHKNIKFNPTGSLCLDAIVANLQSTGCSAVLVTNPDDGVTKISCFKWHAKTPNSEWINNEFYAIVTNTKIPKDVKPICIDKYLTMTSAEKD